MSETQPVAVRAACFPLALCAGYTAAVLGSSAADFADFTLLGREYLWRILLLLLPLLLLATLFYLAAKIVRGETAQSPVSLLASLMLERWQEDRLLSVLVPPVLLTATLASFTTFKQKLLPQAGFGMDAQFAGLDRALFLGHDPWTLSHALFPGPWFSWAFDRIYALWFLPLLVFVLLSWIAPLRLRTQYLLAFTICWVLIGTAAAYLLPGAGPCFVQAFHGTADFSPLMDQLRDHDAALRSSGSGGLAALVGQGELLSAFQSRELMLAGGISAMPSLHNALAALFACAAFAVNRTAGIAMSVFAAAVWVGSIHLGWHYAVDGIVGITLALAVWKLSGVWASRLIGGVQPQSTTRKQPAAPAAAQG